MLYQNGKGWFIKAVFLLGLSFVCGRVSLLAIDFSSTSGSNLKEKVPLKVSLKPYRHLYITITSTVSANQTIIDPFQKSLQEILTKAKLFDDLNFGGESKEDGSLLLALNVIGKPPEKKVAKFFTVSQDWYKVEGTLTDAKGKMLLASFESLGLLASREISSGGLSFERDNEVSQAKRALVSISKEITKYLKKHKKK